MIAASRSLVTVLVLASGITAASLWSVSAQSRVLSEDQARTVLDAIYKGDYQRAFRERKPELLLKFLTTIGTYRDVWQKRAGTWYEVRGDQLRNQTVIAPRP